MVGLAQCWPQWHSTLWIVNTPPSSIDRLGFRGYWTPQMGPWSKFRRILIQRQRKACRPQKMDPHHFGTIAVMQRISPSGIMMWTAMNAATT
jgi:hypothetical protein